MTETTPPVPLTLAARADQVFPTLTAAQIARIAAHGQVRDVQPGEVLVEAGDQVVPFFVVTAGQVDMVQPYGPTNTRRRPSTSTVMPTSRRCWIGSK